MNVSFAHYDTNGRILFTGHVPEDMVILQREPYWVGEADKSLHYIKNGERLDRPIVGYTISGTEVKADNTDKITVLGVLAETHVSIQGPYSIEGTTEEDGAIYFSFTTPGRYVVTLTNFPYQDKEIVIHAV